MSNWVDEMIASYTAHRRSLSEMKRNLNPGNSRDAEDEKVINGMIRDMSETINWLETGRNPVYQKGVHIISIYHVQQMDNMDLIPDIEAQLREENDINKKDLYLTKEEKRILGDIFSSFSLRERQCYILHEGQKMSMSAIADELGVSKSAVQYYIRMARKKVDERISA